MVTISLGVFLLSSLVIADEEKGERAKLVTKTISISTYEGLKPPRLTTKPGTTVIWVNHSRQPAEILFLDKKVTLACNAPVNFFVGKDGAYESAKIPFGGSASLCFIEKGSYDYAYKTSATFYPMQEKEHRGTIVIK
jgi:plastocyanin